MPIMIRIPMPRAKCTLVTAAFWIGLTNSIRPFSASRHVKRNRWTRSSGSCWKSAGKRWRTPARHPTGCRRVSTGIFLAINNSDYFRMLFHPRSTSTPTATTGNAFSIAASRLAYLLNLKGPAICRGHCLFVFAGCTPSGRAEPALGRVRSGPGGRCQPDATARDHDQFLQEPYAGR